MKTDILIIGGGIVGLVAARSLAANGYQTLLIEAKQPQLTWSEDTVDRRVSAINHASQQMLDNLNVWSEIEPHSSPYLKMAVWEDEGTSEIHFDSAELSMPNLGHIIENRVMTRALWTEPSLDNLKLLSAVKPIKLANDAYGSKATLEDGREIEAKLVIGADGTFSWVREQVGITLSQHSYDHTAIVTTVLTEKTHQRTAWQRFFPEPLAFLPLQDPSKCSIVWSAPPEKAKHLMDQDIKRFGNEMAAAYNYRLGQVTCLENPIAFPLYRRQADHYIAPSVALVGDAAHTIHPLAGQGLNLGFADVQCLVAYLQQYPERRPGDYPVLRRYELERRTKAQLMISAMGGIKSLFASDSVALKTIRGLGLSLTNQFNPLKNFFIRQALG